MTNQWIVLTDYAKVHDGEYVTDGHAAGHDFAAARIAAAHATTDAAR